MDRFSIDAALLAWRREFYDPVPLLDDDLRVLYEQKRSLQAGRTGRRLGTIGKELVLGLRHFRAALRLALTRPATN